MKPNGKRSTLGTISLFGVIWIVAQSYSLHAWATLRPMFIRSAPGQESECGTDKAQGTLRVTVVTVSGGKVAGAALTIGLEGESPDLKALTGHNGTYLSSPLAPGT